MRTRNRVGGSRGPGRRATQAQRWGELASPRRVGRHDLEMTQRTAGCRRELHITCRYVKPITTRQRRGEAKARRGQGRGPITAAVIGQAPVQRRRPTRMLAKRCGAGSHRTRHRRAAARGGHTTGAMTRPRSLRRSPRATLARLPPQAVGSHPPCGRAPTLAVRARRAKAR